MDKQELTKQEIDTLLYMLDQRIAFIESMATKTQSRSAQTGFMDHVNYLIGIKAKLKQRKDNGNE